MRLDFSGEIGTCTVNSSISISIKAPIYSSPADFFLTVPRDGDGYTWQSHLSLSSSLSLDLDVTLTVILL